MALASLSPARLDPRDGKTAWVALAGAIALGGLVESLAGDKGALGAVVALAMGSVVALTRWRPVGGLALMAVVAVAQAPFGNPLYDLSIPIFSVAAGLIMAAARTNLRDCAIASLFGAITIGVVLSVSSDAPVGDTVIALVLVLG